MGGLENINVFEYTYMLRAGAYVVSIQRCQGRGPSNMEGLT